MSKEKEKETKETVENGIIVGDPLVLRPTELPLVVKPEKGEWANEAQAKFAKTLNAYAYVNPQKWGVKKGLLIKQLVDLADHPENLKVLAGIADGPGSVSFKNKLDR